MCVCVYVGTACVCVCIMCMCEYSVCVCVSDHHGVPVCWAGAGHVRDMRTETSAAVENGP